MKSVFASVTRAVQKESGLRELEGRKNRWLDSRLPRESSTGGVILRSLLEVPKHKKADVSGSELAPNTAGKSKGEIADEHARERGLQAVKTSPSIQRKLAAEDEGSPILRRGLLGGAAGTGAGALAGHLAGSPIREKMVAELAESRWRGPKAVEEFITGPARKAMRSRLLRGTGIGAGVGLGLGALSGALSKGGSLEKEMGLPKAAAATIKMAQMLKTGNFADPVNRRYPLDSLDDVMEANAYMDKYASEFDPRTRRSVATAIYKRSELLGIPASKSVREIVIRKVASVDVVRGHLEAREVYYGRDSEAGKVCELLKTKVASTHPEVLAEAIAVMDAKYGGDKVWGSWLPEPWDCVFQKTAQDETKDVSTYAYDAGRFHISGIDLVRLAKHSPEVDRRFGKEFAEQFRSDPIQFFDHLPLPEKQVLSQMAHDQDGSGAPLPLQRG